MPACAKRTLTARCRPALCTARAFPNHDANAAARAQQDNRANIARRVVTRLRRIPFQRASINRRASIIITIVLLLLPRSYFPSAGIVFSGARLHCGRSVKKKKKARARCPLIISSHRARHAMQNTKHPARRISFAHTSSLLLYMYRIGKTFRWPPSPFPFFLRFFLQRGRSTKEYRTQQTAHKAAGGVRESVGRIVTTYTQCTCAACKMYICKYTRTLIRAEKDRHRLISSRRRACPAKRTLAFIVNAAHNDAENERPLTDKRRPFRACVVLRRGK